MHRRSDRVPSNPMDADLIDSMQQTAAREQATADGGTGGAANEAPEPAPDSNVSASSKAFFAPSRKQTKIKTGNFRLTVDVLPHPGFSRGDDGADLYTSVAISLEEALTGFTRVITSLDGSLLAIR